MWDINSVREFLKERGYNLIFEEYKNNKEKIFFEKDGYKYSSTINCITRQKDVQSKFSARNPYMLENIKKYMRDNNWKIKLLTKINPHKNDDKLEFQCVCGAKFSATFKNLRKNVDPLCPACSIRRRSNMLKTTKEEANRFLKENGYKIKIIGNYTKGNAPTTFLCDCGNVFTTTFHDVKWSKRIQCPECNNVMSKIERLTENYLRDLGMLFEMQKTFDGCKMKRLLRFDFYLPKLNTCIEVQGEQHYKKKFYVKDWELTQRRDETKRDFCLKNGIKLIEVPWYLYKDNQYKTYILEQLDI